MSQMGDTITLSFVMGAKLSSEVSDAIAKKSF